MKKKEKQMVYKYSWSGMERPVSAEKVGEHILRLEQQYGEVTREVFLESARSEDSEMHKLFEWDDTVAAEKYRLHQANVIIASLRVTVVEEKNEPVVLRGFIQDRTESRGYLNITRALSDKEKRERVLERAYTELRWFREKYGAFKELAGILRAVDEVLKTA